MPGQPCHRRSHGRVSPRTTPVRLATSPAGREHVVLQGGLLLAHFGARRTTRDIDILGQAFTGDDIEITRRVQAIAATDVDDGVTFDSASLKTVPIRDDGRYHDMRLVMPASIARAQLKLQLDVSLGDPITPEPQLIAYQQLLVAETFTILGYPLTTVIAEKLSTAIELGDPLALASSSSAGPVGRATSCP